MKTINRNSVLSHMQQVARGEAFFKKDGSTRTNFLKRGIIWIRAFFTEYNVEVAKKVSALVKDGNLVIPQEDISRLKERLLKPLIGSTNRKSAIEKIFADLLNPKEKFVDPVDSESSDIEVESADGGDESENYADFLKLAGGDQDIVDMAIALGLGDNDQIKSQILIGVKKKYDSLIEDKVKRFPQLRDVVKAKRQEILGPNENHTAEKYEELFTAIDIEFGLLYVFKEEDVEIQDLLKGEIADKKAGNGGRLTQKDVQEIERTIRAAVKEEMASNARKNHLKGLVSVTDIGAFQEFEFYLSNQVGVLISKMSDEGILSEEAFKHIKNTIVRAKRLKKSRVKEEEIKKSVDANEGLLTKNEFEKLKKLGRAKGHTVVSPFVRFGFKEHVIENSGGKDLLTYFNEEVTPALKGKSNEDVIIYLVENFESSFVDGLLGALHAKLELSGDVEILTQSDSIEESFDGLVIEMIGSRIPGYVKQIDEFILGQVNELFGN